MCSECTQLHQASFKGIVSREPRGRCGVEPTAQYKNSRSIIIGGYFYIGREVSETPLLGEGGDVPKNWPDAIVLTGAVSPNLCAADGGT